jgi:4-hydroxybenzoate polyprenyltransferase
MEKNSIKAYLDLCRVSNLPTVWTNVLAALVLSGAEFSWCNFIILSVSMSLFYSGGMCLNDICDASIDMDIKPTRPMPSGRISPNHAVRFTVALFVTALILLLAVPYLRAFYAGLLLTVVIIAYDKSHKSHYSSVILMASCRLLVFVVAALAATGSVAPYALLAGCLQFAYVLAISVTARFEKSHPEPFHYPVIPVMIAYISLLDGVAMSLFSSPVWIMAGMGGTVLTQYGQKYVRGD